MADSTRRLAPHTPDWQVLGVLADGDGLPEFSYTVGLHQRGLPELFFWDSPSGGDDPGGDWFLRHLERGHLLNRWARDLIEGRLHPGTTWTELMDFGLATLTFTCGDLVEPLEVEALMADPSAKVMPIRYALHRDPLRKPAEVDATAAAEIRQWTADVVEALVARGRTARLPVAPYDVSCRQQFGPATSLVTALRAAVSGAEPTEVNHLLLLSLTFEMRGMIHAELANGAVRAFARAAGLHKEADAADRAAFADAHRISKKIGVRRELSIAWQVSPGTRDGCKALDSLAHQLGNALAAAYMAAVVVDVLTPELRAASLSPVLTALTDGTMPRLWCAPAISAPARLALADLPMAKLVPILNATNRMEHTTDIHVVALMGAGDSPPAAVLLDGTPTLARILAAAWAGSDRGALRMLTDVARALIVGDMPEAAAVRRLLDP